MVMGLLLLLLPLLVLVLLHLPVCCVPPGRLHDRNGLGLWRLPRWPRCKLRLGALGLMRP